MINVSKYVVGVMKTNCYLICDDLSGESALIDPGGMTELMREEIQKNQKIKYIFLTHGHFDHILKVSECVELTGAKVVIGQGDVEFAENDALNLSRRFCGKGFLKHFKPDITAKNGDLFYLGDCEIEVIDAPGHTRGSVCYVTKNCIFSGDTLFKNGIGTTDFVTGSLFCLKNSLKKLYGLPGNYKIYPGHGDWAILENEKTAIKGILDF